MISMYRVPVNAKPLNDKVLSLYNQFLASAQIYKYQKTISFKVDRKRKFRQKIVEDINIASSYFNVIDIDNNGIKELVIKPSYNFSNSSAPCGLWYYVFTVNAGKVVPVGHGYRRQDNSATIYYMRSKSALLYDYGTAGTDSIFIYYMRDGMISKVDAYYRETDWDANSEKFYKNGKRISYSKYKIEAWNIKTMKVNLYKNTDYNRQLILE